MKTLFTRIDRLLVVALLIVGANAWSQSTIPDVQWSKINGGYFPSPARVSITTDGNVVGIGEKLSLAGDTLQTLGLETDKFFGPASFPAGTTKDGGIITFYHLFVNRFPYNNDVHGGFAKLDATGKEIFRHDLYSGNEPKYPSFGTIRQVLGTPDNGFLFLYSDGTLTRYNPAGELLWRKTITHQMDTGESKPIRGESVINIPDDGSPTGGLLLVGYMPGIIDDPTNAANPSTGWVARLDSQGNVRWEKLLTSFSAINANFIHATYTITDATIAADGNEYALVGLGYAFSSLVQAPPRPILLELDANGNQKRGQVYGSLEPTSASIALYTGGDGNVYYALGNTAQKSPVFDYQIQYCHRRCPGQSIGIAGHYSPAYLSPLRQYSRSAYQYSGGGRWQSGFIRHERVDQTTARAAPVPVLTAGGSGLQLPDGGHNLYYLRWRWFSHCLYGTGRYPNLSDR